MRPHLTSLACPLCGGVCFALPGGEVELKTIVECLACGTYTLYADLQRSDDHLWPIKIWADGQETCASWKPSVFFRR